MLIGSKLSALEKVIQNADTYQEYYEACKLHDELSGANEWKTKNQSHEYDYRLIKKRLERIKAAKARQDAAGLMSILHEGIHGNLGNISNPELRKHAKIGTKKLIEEFLDEVCTSLDFIYQADEQDVDFYEKLSFFNETTHAYGQSCLMLSGGAGLGFFHAGVVKALLEHDLLPGVLSGASAGSIIAALVGTRSNEELKEILTAESIYEQFQGWSSWRGLSKKGLLDSTNLENSLIDLFGLTTFEEAYKKTGRHMTITVSPADLHQQSRLLNSKTSPNAIITQAVRASCAIPYVFSPVYLRAKTAEGKIVPYIPHRKFADGSLMADLPFDRLARLYGVNHSIVSQTNPLVTPFISSTKGLNNSISAITMRHIANLAKRNSIYVFDVLESLTSNPSIRLGVHKIRSIIDQQYVGDINILPKRSFVDYKHLLTNPSQKRIEQLIFSAEKAAWSEIDLIKRNTKISKHFRKYLKLLQEREGRILTKRTELKLVSGQK